jgi:hypothetical protein
MLIMMVSCSRVKQFSGLNLSKLVACLHHSTSIGVLSPLASGSWLCVLEGNALGIMEVVASV